MKMGISVNRCVEVEHLEESINQGTLMSSQNCRWREPTTDDCKSQGTQMTLESYPRINYHQSMGWNLVEGGH